MRTRLTRLVGAVAVVFAVGTVGVAGAGTASAAAPVVAGSCATTVEGEPGTPVSLSPAAVTQPIVDVVRAVPLLGPPLAEPFRSAFNALPPIPIGAIPTGQGVITGGEIANKVTAELGKLPLLGPVLGTVVGGTQSALAGVCGVTVKGVNAVVAPVQEGSKQVADASQQAVGQVVPGLPGSTPGTQPGTNPGTQPGTTPGTSQPGTTPGTGQTGGGTTTVGGTPAGGVTGGLALPLYGSNPFGANLGRVPLFSYGSLPFAMPGQYSPSPGVRYGTGVPGSTSLGGLPTSADVDGVQTAGRAQALPVSGRMGGVAAPVLLAVLALSCVTGALVRTWVLRRSPAARVVNA
ncbi:hypothetical protein [Actinosynnema sp. NPDC020468]|uniref:hypothetical protein n=1 Tax=Actinosynnema sp. NPDC020468 TaxID=3154488 RepID=UPI00340D0BFF